MSNIFGDVARHLLGIQRPRPHQYQIGRLEPGKFQLPHTPETEAARVVCAQSDFPYEEWLAHYRKTGRSRLTR